MRLCEGKAQHQRTAHHITAAAAERELMAYVTIFFIALWAMVLPEFIAAISKTIFG